MKRLLGASLFVVLVGCGGSAGKPAAAPEAGGASTHPEPGGGLAPSSSGATPTLASPDAASAQIEFDDASKAFSAAGNDCAALCKALASMTRATDRLCELAKEDPKRCTDAKSKLESAEAKVKATCGGGCG